MALRKRLLFFLLSLRIAHAQWTPIPGPGGGAAADLAPAGSEVCAAASNGIYCTSAEREAWVPIGLYGKPVANLAKTRSGWVALTEDQDTLTRSPSYALRFSTDAGAHWEALPDSGFTADDHALEAYGDSIVYSNGDTGHRLSADGGRTWMNLGLPDSGFGAGCTLSQEAVLCGSQLGVSVRRASGSAWNRIVKDSCYASSFTGGKAYISTRGQIRRIGPEGIEFSWPQPVPSASASFVLASESLLIVASDGGHYAAFPGSTAWSRLPVTPNTGSIFLGSGTWTAGAGFVRTLASIMRVRPTASGIELAPFGKGLQDVWVRFEDRNGTLFANTLEGLYRRENGGAWTPLFRSGFYVGSAWNEPGVGMVLGLLSSLFPSQISLDEGVTWSGPPPGLDGSIRSMVKIGGAYVALSQSMDTQDKWISTAPAIQGPWSSRPLGEPPCAGPMQASATRLLVPCGDSLWSSTDMGMHWGSLPLPGSGVLAVDGRRALYAADGLFESEDGGAKWNRIPLPWPAGAEPKAFAFSGADALALVRLDSYPARFKVYPLPGSDPKWNALPGHEISGEALSLCIHDGVPWVGLTAQGGLVYDKSLSIEKRGSGRRGGAGLLRKAGRNGWDARGRSARPVPHRAPSPLFRSLRH